MEYVATLMESTSSKIQQLQRAFAELESQSAVSLNMKWKRLEDHFHGLEQLLKKKFDELREQEFEETVAKLDQMLEQQEAVVVAKKLNSLEKLQEKRDAVLAMIFGKSKLSLPVLVINPMNKALVNNTIFNGNTGALTVNWSKSAPEDGVQMQYDNTAVKPRSELLFLCEEMSIDGLHKFISNNRKNLTAICEEIPIALLRASDSYGLVLDSLEDFYSGDNLVLDGKKKDENLLGVRRTCLMLMESLGQLQSDAIAGNISNGQVLASNMKERSKKCIGMEIQVG